MTGRSLIAACLILPMLLAGSVQAQVPAGHFLVTERSAQTLPQPQGGLFLYEPLRAMTSPLDTSILGDRRAHKAIIGRNAATLIAALPLGVGDEIIAMTLAANRVVAVETLHTTPARTVDLERLPGGILLVATRAQVFRLRPTTNSLTLIPLPRDVGEVFVDLTHIGSTAVVLTQTVNGNSRILAFDPTAPSSDPMPIDAPMGSAISYDPTQHAFLVGTEIGEIFLVDADRLISQLFGLLPNPRVNSIAYNQDQMNHLLGSIGELHVWDNGVRSTVPTPHGIRVTDIDYNPYLADFVHYGFGCSQSMFQPDINTVGRAFPGSDFFAITVDGAPPDSLGVLFIGRNETALPLDQIGMNGCALLVDRIIRSPSCIAGANGRGAVPLSIPPDPGLAGLNLFMQWIIIDPNANALGISTSRGGHITL